MYRLLPFRRDKQVRPTKVIFVELLKGSNILTLKFNTRSICQSHDLSKKSVMSFRKMAYPIRTSKEVVTIGINFLPTFAVMRDLG